MNKIAKIELRALYDNPQFLAAYTQGVQLLKQSGVIAFLRMFARPYIQDAGASIEKTATSAAYAAGYQDCLDELLYFVHKYSIDSIDDTRVQPDFGGLKLAIERGHLTEDEARRLRTK